MMTDQEWFKSDKYKDLRDKSIKHSPKGKRQNEGYDCKRKTIKQVRYKWV